MKEHRVSFRYARALLESAKKEEQAEIIYNDLQKVKAIFEMSNELCKLAASPIVQLNRKKKIFKEIFESQKLTNLTMDFLQLLVDKRRGNLILSIISEYESQYNVYYNRLIIQVSSAIELDNNLKEQVIKKIAAWTKMNILAEYKINTDLKGGIFVKIGDWVFDASIKNQLNVLHRTLSEGKAS